MKIGVTLRNMGPQSLVEVLLGAAKAADAAGVESLWITDHIAIPPDDAEGSGGRYLDPLVTLGVLAGSTQNIKLATGVLILPYRPALPTVKQIATLQELSANRLLLGVGIGWMDAEFRALGLDRHRRGRDSDALLAFLHRCFEADLVEAHGQPFLFKPRPPRPPIYVGGRGAHALTRAIRYGDGWLPMGIEPDRLAQDMTAYQQIAAEHGVPCGRVTLMRALPLTDRAECEDLIARYEDLGVERIVCGMGYDTIDDYRRSLELLTRFI